MMRPAKRKTHAAPNSTNMRTKETLVSPLLALPPELRNKIYAYTLTFPDGLHYSHTPGVTRRQRKHVLFSDTMPANSLKYACKQLYGETAGLEIQFNAVILSYHNLGSTVHQLDSFTAHFTPSRLLWLTDVILELKDTEHDTLCVRQWVRSRTRSILRLLDFAAKHPHTRIKLRLPPFRISGSAILFENNGLVLSAVFRGRDINGRPLNLRDVGLAALYARLWKWMLGEHEDEIRDLVGPAGNLKFFPRAEEWREEEFVDKLLAEWTARGLTLCEERRKVVIENAREWMENGI